MKSRIGFVSNSSSSSFVIENKTKARLKLKDFIVENKQISHDGQRNRGLEPGGNYIVFGDEQGTLIGKIYDYILRDGGESKRFKCGKRRACDEE